MSAIKQLAPTYGATTSALPAMSAHPTRSGAPTPPVVSTGRAEPRPRDVRRHLARGQSTVEYALLVVGIATVALLVLAWASSTDVVGALFDRVFRWVTGRVG